MYLLLVDRSACPRCGPGFGLILLADRLDDRRIGEGVLGCSNCRERYPVRHGVADLRAPPRSRLEMPPDGANHGPAEAGGLLETRALRAAAASGIGPAGGTLLLMGATASLAGAIASLLPSGSEVVGAQAVWPAAPAEPGVSHIVVGETLPFFTSTFAGVVLAGSEASTVALREAARVLLPGHRVVVLDPPEDVQARLGGVGLLRFVRGEGVAAAGR